ncbi:MAG: glycosyltransferase family 39 protein [Methylococcaceae bacterium]|nr:glycosyltransferase family 39 protein [Methylococcaceae bacterium]
MNHKTTTYLLALLAGAGAAAISFYAPLFPYGVDSAGYIDQARSFLDRGVFEVHPYNRWGAGVDPQPAKLFPPGYPILIVIGSLLFQLPVEVIAPFLSLAALFVLPWIIVVAFRRALGLWPAFWIALLVGLTPSVVKYGYVAFSDLPSLVWVIFVVHRLLVADNRPISWFYLGLLSGFAYLMRNANLGLLLVISIYISWQFVIESETRRETLKNGLVWAAGNVLILAPWLIRNLLVFGKLQPYSMAPSSVSLGENIHDYLKSQSETLSTLGPLDAFLADHIAGAVLLLILFALSLQQVIRTWGRWQDIEQKAFLLSVVYIAFGVAITIAARTTYEWGEHIIARYAIPYSCFIFVALTIVLKNTTFKINTRYVGLAAASALLVLRFYQLPSLYHPSSYKQGVLKMARQIEADPKRMCDYSKGRVVISNEAFVYRILCGYRKH